MSKTKHKAYRKILAIKTYNTTYAGETVPCKAVIWCLVDSLTSRTVRTSHIGVTTYIDGYKGVAARFNSKGMSINLKNPLASKSLAGWSDKYGALSRAERESFNKAYRNFIVAPERSKQLTGTVLWFDNGRGEGMVRCNKSGLNFVVYACNMVGKKTWYAETACMYVERDQQVTFDLADMGDFLTACITEGQKFDAEKWNSLDQSKLAFKCNEEGEAVNGLFSHE